MKLKEHIYHAINQMDTDELTLLYEHIQLLEHMKRLTSPTSRGLSIDMILDMTSSSQSSWTESVIEERAER